MPKTIVYILSTNYAGSHFLSLLLGSNSQARHIGEVKGLRRHGRGRRKIARACPGKSPAILLGPWWYVYLHKWLAQNRHITDFIDGHQLDARIVTYRDLALDTGATLQHLTEWAGLSYEPSQLAFWNFEHHGTQKHDYEWIKECRASYFDARWQSSLPLKIQQAIIKSAAVQGYIQKLGLQMHDEGLTQKNLPNDAGQ